MYRQEEIDWSQIGSQFKTADLKFYIDHVRVERNRGGVGRPSFGVRAEYTGHRRRGSAQRDEGENGGGW